MPQRAGRIGEVNSHIAKIGPEEVTAALPNMFKAKAISKIYALRFSIQGG